MWHHVDLSECCVELFTHEDRLYMGNDDLFIVDVNSGELLWRYTTPSQKERGRGAADFNDGVIIDLERKRMYLSDGYFMLCLRHPDL